MDTQTFLDFILHKFWIYLIQLFILYLLILAGEWYAETRGLNLFERAFVIAIITLPLLAFILWLLIGRRFLLF